MPTISMFLGILIMMRYGGEHNPPHFHAEYQGSRGIFTMDGDMIEGDIPTRQLKFIAAWAELHKDELLANWKLAREDKELFRIEPLR